MRPTTSVLTTAVLGAAVTASTVLAQQLRAPDGAPQGDSAAAGSTPATGSASPVDSSGLFGIAPSRGARHLLRNGLDYLNYQQYERALKFLRDAETRQKELNEPEKLALKQGIERAQRGLREAADAESPYAISERSRRRNGFAPAQAETRVATNATQTKLPVQKTKTNRPTPLAPLASDGDDQGEPIRLASGETPVTNPTVDANSDTPPTQTTNAAPPVGSERGQPANMPEIPHIPPVSPLADPTETGGSAHQLAAGEQSATGTGSTGTQAAATSRQTPVPPAEKQHGQPELLSSLPPLAPASELTPQATNPSPANAAPTAEPATAEVTGVTAQPPTPTTAQSVDTSPPPEAIKRAPVIDLETITSGATSPTSSPSVDPSAPPHRESEEATPATAPGAVENTPANSPSANVTATPTATQGVSEPPLLPPNLGRPVATAAIPETSANPSATASAPLTASSGAEDLPPLPADLGRSDAANPATTASPARGNDIPASPLPAGAEASTQPAQVGPAPLADAPAPIGDVQQPAGSTGDNRKPDGHRSRNPGASHAAGCGR